MVMMEAAAVALIAAVPTLELLAAYRHHCSRSEAHPSAVGTRSLQALGVTLLLVGRVPRLLLPLPSVWRLVLLMRRVLSIIMVVVVVLLLLLLLMMMTTITMIQTSISPFVLRRLQLLVLVLARSVWTRTGGLVRVVQAHGCHQLQCGRLIHRMCLFSVTLSACSCHGWARDPHRLTTTWTPRKTTAHCYRC